jgi:hypothetical protein
MSCTLQHSVIEESSSSFILWTRPLAHNSEEIILGCK